jgi:hypothetical protein
MGTNLFGIAFRKKYYKGKIINDNLKIFKKQGQLFIKLG